MFAGQIFAFLWLALAAVHTVADNSTVAPKHNATVAPEHNATVAPEHNATVAPEHNATTAPHDNVTLAPTPSPHHNHTNGTLAPTPSPQPANATIAPTPSVPQNSTLPPTMAPTAYSEHELPHHHMSFWRMMGKTLAWLILIGLSVVAFGAIMSHRYRIYFFLRGLWYTVWRLDCTRWILSKLRLGDRFGGGSGGGDVDGGLNTIIFDNEMNEGLLMRESDRDT